ncbi:MAG TPA: hypothetical protein VMI47_11105 [Pseudolabrys sp.]|nr:hypothetical protein [Pseudolabrys sp.]
MRAVGLPMAFAAALLAISAGASFAQNSAGHQEKGSTGWSGASKDQPSQSAGKATASTTGQKTAAENDAAEARDQPFMATGEDLNGPPTQFAPDATPE